MSAQMYRKTYLGTCLTLLAVTLGFLFPAVSWWQVERFQGRSQIAAGASSGTSRLRLTISLQALHATSLPTTEASTPPPISCRARTRRSFPPKDSRRKHVTASH